MANTSIAQIKDNRNVVDYYKYWNNLDIKAHLNSRRFNYSILCVNILYDINIAGIIRNANAFMAQEVILYGNKRWDRRGAVGVQNYTNFQHVRETYNLDLLFSQFDVIIGIDNVDGAENISDYTWDHNKKTLICFGQEACGLPKEIFTKCNKILYIKQYGTTRSLNVASASAVVMSKYCEDL